jgi:ComF family protein
VFRALLDIIFPPLCHACKEFIPDAGDLHLCVRCRGEVRAVTSPLCATCGIPFATPDGIDHLCGACLATHPRYTAARAAVLFDGVARDLIHRFKYDRKVHLARALSLLTNEALAPFASSSGAELLIPVPLHRRRLRERGFNQAVLLGRSLAKAWHIPLVVDNLKRIRWTEPQVTLSASEREANVRGAFALADPAAVRGKKIILLDDVYTTGSTVAECSRVLRQAGAEGVYVITVARAV